MENPKDIEAWLVVIEKELAAFHYSCHIASVSDHRRLIATVRELLTQQTPTTRACGHGCEHYWEHQDVPGETIRRGKTDDVSA